MAEGRQLVPPQEISSGEQIQHRDPKASPFTQPVTCPNLKFNTALGWTIVEGDGAGGRLNEGGNYTYSTSLVVEPNWLMKVNTIVYGFGESNFETNLRENVTISGGGDPNPEPSTAYQFCVPTNTVRFQIVGPIDPRTKIIHKNGVTYTFIGWSSEEPRIISTPLNPFEWDSRDISYNHTLALSQFGTTGESIYRKDEWAAFIDYENVTIIVTTNQHSTSGFENDKLNFTFTIPSTGRTETHYYMSVPTIQENPAIVLTGNDIGENITVENLISQYSGYEFAGWYYGEWTDPDNPPSTYISSPGSAISNYVLGIGNPLILTACFFRSGSIYTITYHAGLPNI